MWNNVADQNSEGSVTPPLPTRSPAPPPPTFIRSHSLGKNETKLSSQEENTTVGLNLLGRHTHHYPNKIQQDTSNFEITKVINEILNVQSVKSRHQYFRFF